MRAGGGDERALVWNLSTDVDRQLVEKVLLEIAKWNREAAAEAHTGTHRHAHTHRQAHTHTYKRVLETSVMMDYCGSRQIPPVGF